MCINNIFYYVLFRFYKQFQGVRSFFDGFCLLSEVTNTFMAPEKP